MPKIAAFHSDILITTESGDLVSIKTDLDDWYPEGEVLEMISSLYPGCRTLGVFVSSMDQFGFDRGNKSPKNKPVLSCCIESVDECAQAAVARSWSDVINP